MDDRGSSQHHSTVKGRKRKGLENKTELVAKATEPELFWPVVRNGLGSSGSASLRKVRSIQTSWHTSFLNTNTQDLNSALFRESRPGSLLFCICIFYKYTLSFKIQKRLSERTNYSPFPLYI